MDIDPRTQVLIELTPSRRPAGKAEKSGKIEIVAGGRLVGSLSASSITALNIRAGDVLTEDTLRRIEHRMSLERAYKAAGDALARRMMTSTELREKLERRGFDPEIVEETVAALTKQGIVNNAEVAREIVRQAVSHAGAGLAFIESKLAAKGVDAETARKIIEDQQAGAMGSAEDTARRRAQSFPQGLSTQVKARRLYAYLARRGFEERESTEAVRRVLGAALDSSDPSEP